MPNRIERDYKNQSIENKESYKWIEVAQKSKEVLKEAESVTRATGSNRIKARIRKIKLFN